jgi:hypothetical protein
MEFVLALLFAQRFADDLLLSCLIFGRFFVRRFENVA